MNRNERKREENLYTGFLGIPPVFQSGAILPEIIRICADAGKYPLSRLIIGTYFNRTGTQEICAGSVKNQNLFSVTGVLSGQVVASVPFFFASEAFYFVIDQVIYVEGGILSVL